MFTYQHTKQHNLEFTTPSTGILSFHSLTEIATLIKKFICVSHEILVSMILNAPCVDVTGNVETVLYDEITPTQIRDVLH